MDIELLKDKLKKSLMTSHILLANARFLDIGAKQSPEFDDPKYLPFYFYLGQQLPVGEVIQIGPRLGLPGLCFCQGNKTVKGWLALDPDINSWTHARARERSVETNIVIGCNREVEVSCTGMGDKPMDNEAEWGNPRDGKAPGNKAGRDLPLVMLTDSYDQEDYAKYLDFLWGRLKTEGYLIADYIHTDDLRETFADFCRVKNREPVEFNTRYGVGIVQR